MHTDEDEAGEAFDSGSSKVEATLTDDGMVEIEDMILSREEFDQIFPAVSSKL